MRIANGMDEFYSRNKLDGNFEYFVDQYGNYKMDHPHIHIIFYESKNMVRIVASQDWDDHPWRIDLDNPDGNEVNHAIRLAIPHLNWY